MSNTNHHKRNSRTDLEWCIDRLEHLLFIYDNPGTVDGSFGQMMNAGGVTDQTMKKTSKLCRKYRHLHPDRTNLKQRKIILLRKIYERRKQGIS